MTPKRRTATTITREEEAEEEEEGAEGETRGIHREPVRLLRFLIATFHICFLFDDTQKLFIVSKEFYCFLETLWQGLSWSENRCDSLPFGCCP